MSELAEAAVRLNRIAQIVGNRIFGVDLGVSVSGDRLVFVDGSDDPIMNDGEEIIAVTPEELQQRYEADFAVRALRAAGIAKYQEIEASRAP